MSCVVEGCTSEATTPILLAQLAGKDLADYGPWTVVACDFHAQALNAGEPYSLGDDRKIRLGTDAPPRLLGYVVNEQAFNRPELTLKLGHDGIVSQVVTVQISDELAEQLYQEDSELGKEVDRNKPRTE